MTTPKWPDHDPDAVLDYGRLWSAWLNGDTIATSDWIINADADDLSPVTELAKSHSATTTTLWLQGGTPGKKYTIVNHITTNSSPIPRENDRSISIKCKER